MERLIDIEKAKQPLHHHLGIRCQVVPVSPAKTHVPLQMICFFDQTKNQVMEGGTADVDAHFNGSIKELRKADHFRGQIFETLLITPQKNEIPAEQLLLIGLGDPEDFSLTRIESIGSLTIHEAMKLKVTSFAFAPDIKDAGISGFAAADVSEALAKGMSKALKSAYALAEMGLAAKPVLEEIIFLAGAKHIQDSQQGLRKFLE